MDNIDSILKVGALCLLGVALIVVYLNSKATLKTIEVASKDIPRKSELITQSQWNFNILFASVLVIVAGVLELIEKQTFIVFLMAVLASLGIKSVVELRAAIESK
ncbi:hypothetical protein LA59_10630 [Vibrio harveyi]|uniref:hypothetical protein n=1 Tax=Vibrio harveyi TaxID=669 RepID=UPI0005395A75|nr:hypothetical protein [Vibrio harveyi]AIV05902.1 hypothetical protein LA59_10630 [Vibrio harveyi]